MTEGEARDWIAARHGVEKLEALSKFVQMLLAANASQNLIGKASEPQIWVRHILDSAQLADFAPRAANWLDIGSGAGLPGIVLGVVTSRPILLVEPRRKRVEFLAHASELLGLANVRIKQSVIERVEAESFDAVTARAYAALPDILSSTVRLTIPSTVWVLPKGRTAERELADARQAWQGVFHVEQSVTDNEARIIVATDVRAR